MAFDEIKRNADLYKRPDQGTYKPSHSMCEQRITGCFNFKAERSGHIEEAGLIGKLQPTYKDKKYSLVEPRVKLVQMIKPKEIEKPKRESLSPTSYNPLD